MTALWLTAAVSFGQGIPTGPIAPASLPIDPGETVTTCFSSVTAYPNNYSNGIINQNGYVVALVDTRNPPPSYVATATGTQYWRAPMFHNENTNSNDPNIWNARNLGQVFGLALDDRPNPNIYVAASTVYGEFNDPANAPRFTFGPGGSGAIYRLDGNTGAICLLAQLSNNNPSDPRSGTGLGNIAFSTVGDYLYVSNMDDGLIYRVPTSPCPNPVGLPYMTYDHGIDGRLAEGLIPIADDSNSRYTQLGRRVWGLAVNETERRLYYAVWWEHRARSFFGNNPQGIINPSEDNEIWSVALDSSGAFIPSSATLEFRQPPYFGGPLSGVSNPVSDISFSPAGALLLAERTRAADSGLLQQPQSNFVNDSHASRALEYTGSHLTWVASNVNKYRVGTIFDNSAGGIVADCNENVWVSGDLLSASQYYVYGIQRIPAGGNLSHSPPTANSHIIDLDDFTAGTLAQLAKSSLGDVAIHNACGCKFVTDQILCEIERDPLTGNGQVTGDYVLTGVFTNCQNIPGTHLLLPPNAISPPGVRVCFGNGNQTRLLSPPLNNGDSVTIGQNLNNSDAIIIKNALPGQEVCFRMILRGANGVECCKVDVCVVIPACDCFQIDHRLDVIELLRPCCVNGNVVFKYCFQLTNLFGQNVYHAFVGEVSPVSFSPDYFNLATLNNGPLGHAQSMPLCIDFIAPPNQTIKFLLTIHNEDFSECCSQEVSIKVPNCPDCNSVPVMLGGFVCHAGWSGSGSNIDNSKSLHRAGTVSQQLTFNNLISTSHGINCVCFTVQNLPNLSGLSASDFAFRISPQGAFSQTSNPISSWPVGPAPSSVTVLPGNPDRIKISWPNNTVENRWLCIQVKANANTGLTADEVYYVGHLCGETTGPSSGLYTVSFADISLIRTAVGSTVDASSIMDIDKNGTVNFADISAMRNCVGLQLTNITVP